MLSAPILGPVGRLCDVKAGANMTQARLEALRLLRRAANAVDQRTQANAATRLLDKTFPKPRLSAREVSEVLGVDFPVEMQGDATFSGVVSVPSQALPGVLYAQRTRARANVDALLEKGVAAFIHHKQLHDQHGNPVPTFIFPKPLTAFVRLLDHIRSRQDTKIVAVTGSFGKTTVKDMIYLVASTQLDAERSWANANGFHPIARNVQDLRQECEVLVQETGAGRPRLVERSSRFLRPNAFVVTNIGLDHAGRYAGGQKGVLKDKLSHDKYLREGGVAFMNWDDPVLREVKLRHPIVWYSTEDEGADYYSQNVLLKDGEISFEVVERTTAETTRVVLHTHGLHNVGNAVVAFAVGKWLGVRTPNIVKGLAKYKGWGTRQNLTEIEGHRTLVDCYNASEASVKSTLDAVETFQVSKGGRRVLVLGALDGRLGEHARGAHERVGLDLAAREGIDVVVLYGEESKWTAEELDKAGRPYFYAQTRQELSNFLAGELREGDLVAWKGGQETALALSIDALHSTDFVAEDMDDYNRRSETVETREGAYRDVAELGGVFYKLYDRNIRHLNIASSVNGVPVYMVGRSACSGSNLESVTMRAPVRTIGARAFARSRKLREVTFPSTLKFVGPKAFRGCTSLRAAVLPEGVTTIGDLAFRDCWRLREVHLPDSLLTIGDGIFDDCPLVRIHVKRDSAVAKKLAKEYSRFRLRHH